MSLTSDLDVVLVGMSSYQEVQKIRAGLKAAVGVVTVVLDSESPGLMTLKVTCQCEVKGLADQLRQTFSDQYEVIEKQRPSGRIEINIRPYPLVSRQKTV